MSPNRLFLFFVLLSGVASAATAQSANTKGRPTRENSATGRRDPERARATGKADILATQPMARAPSNAKIRQDRVVPAGYAADPPTDENRARVFPPVGKERNSRALPLKRRGEVPAGPDSPGTRSKPVSILLTAASSLSIVLGLFAVVVWIARRRAGNPLPLLPQDVIDVLGRTRIAERQTLQLIRLGHRLLLVSVTPTGAETLAEVTEREEVDRIVGLCNQYRPGSSSATFRDVLSELGTRSGSRLVRDLAVAQPKATSITTAR